MRFTYPARLQRTGADEIVISFRDLPECLTCGADEVEALAEAADAIEEAIAGRIDDRESIPRPQPASCGRAFGLCTRRHRGEGGAVGCAAGERHEPRRPGRPPRHRRAGRAQDARSAPPQFREPHSRGATGARPGPRGRDPRRLRPVDRCRGVRGPGIAAARPGDPARAPWREGRSSHQCGVQRGDGALLTACLC